MSILRVPCESGYRPMVYPRKVLGRSMKDRLQVQDSMETGGGHWREAWHGGGIVIRTRKGVQEESGCGARSATRLVTEVSWGSAR